MRGLLVLLAGLAFVTAPALAQKTDPGANLRALLMKKYGTGKAAKPKAPGLRRSLRGLPKRRPKTPGPETDDESATAARSSGDATPSTGTAPKSRELIVIEPGSKSRMAPATRAIEKRSDIERIPHRTKTVANNAALNSAGSSRMWDTLRSLWSASQGSNDSPLALTAAAAGTGLPTLTRPRTGTRPATPARVRLAQAKSSRMRKRKAVAIVPGTYIIQFKHSATSKQLDDVNALLKKHGLEIVNAAPALDLVYVLPKKVGGARARSASVPRADAPAGDVLDPQFLKEIRKQPGVNAATVLPTIAPKSIPRASGAKVIDDGKEYSWTWSPIEPRDGNWGLKRMRMPSVWRILNAYRSGDQPTAPARMGFLDSGFGWHGHLTYNRIYGLAEGERLLTPGPSCEESHGTHVAGIAGAAHGRGRGIDGIVPEARIDAIPLGIDFVIHGMEAGIQDAGNQNAILFTSALGQLVQYLTDVPAETGTKRVINISLGFNWRGTGGGESSEDIADGQLVNEGKRTIILMLAKMLQQSLTQFEDDTLFVIAAGNDSHGLAKPLNAKWSSPFAYLGLESSLTFARSPNIIVVEAVTRQGTRATFSNVGGHVSAPGVDIMSTVGGRREAYRICDGTSQAAPHVAALASILIELSPDKSPAEIVRIIQDSAIPDPEGTAAPRVDALEAVLRAKPEAIRILADLNRDNVVNADDLITYKRYRDAMNFVFVSGFETFFHDFNDDGIVTDNEHWFPRIDLNGSGQAISSLADLRCVAGKPVSDLGVLALAWDEESEQSFDEAAAGAGMGNPGSPPNATACPW